MYLKWQLMPLLLFGIFSYNFRLFYTIISKNISTGVFKAVLFYWTIVCRINLKLLSGCYCCKSR